MVALLQEARVAVEQIVIPKGQAAELLPRSPEVLALQIKLVESYQLASEKLGSSAMNRRLRILPSPLIVISDSRSSDSSLVDVPDEEAEEVDDDEEEFDSDVEDLGVSVPGGTSPGRLPVLPE